MSQKVDSFYLDESNHEFNNAAELVLQGEKLIYLTGKAGAGKTTFLKFIRQVIEKKTIVLAPTGVAALNAGGQTIHSFFKIAPSIYLPDDYRLRQRANPEDVDKRTIYDFFTYRKNHKNLIKSMELLIIDEISMVRCDLLDVVNNILKTFRENESDPFGGVQVVLIGDAYQLPPIVSDEHWQLLSQFYKSPFFFDSNVLTNSKPKYLELKKIYRQSDQKFINLLNNIRTNNIKQEDMDLLNSRFIPSMIKNDNLDYITIATHNRIVDGINTKKLDELISPERKYESEIIGDFPDSILPTDKMLRLKIGAQIMFIRNDSEKKYYNGKLGRIKLLDNDKITITLKDGKDIELSRDIWENVKFIWNDKEKKIEEDIIGQFIQFPIKLAWSVTVHKCQGLTFDKIIADLSSSFSAGQVYVALSRCTSLEGILLKSRINRNVIKTDPYVERFSENQFL